MASPETKAASNYPVSMGPGARPVQPGNPNEIREQQASFRQFAEQRSKYSITKEDGGIRLGYELKDVPRNHFIAYENMPAGAFMRAMLFSGDTNTTVTGTFIVDMIRGIENTSGKMLTQTQAEGVALHSSKRMLYSTSSMYVATIGGMYIAWRGRKDMKFPFIKPRPSERYNNFPNRYIPIIKGQQARLMWHLNRGFIWVGLGVVLLSPVFNSMGGVSMITGLYRDDRTKEMMKGLKGSLQRIQSNMPSSGAPGQTAPPLDAYTRDDSSPSAFSNTGAESSDGFSGGGYEEQGFGTAYDGGEAGATQKPTPRSFPTARSQGVSPRPSQEQDTGGSDFLFDDASPTAGNDPDMSAPAQYQGGSAWERLRGTRNQAQRQPLPSRLPPREQDESFSFSGGDAEKVVAKQQAQKEFDAMLERERRESGSVDYDRGMNATQQGQENPGGGDGGSAWSRRRGS